MLFEDPASFDIVKETDLVWVIKDKFPKARTHLLVIPKVRLLNGIADLRPEHAPLLRHMREVAAEYDGCIIGFHKEPSMRQLHLHIVSSDLSLCKTKKHRESFRPENMVRLEDLTL